MIKRIFISNLVLFGAIYLMIIFSSYMNGEIIKWWYFLVGIPFVLICDVGLILAFYFNNGGTIKELFKKKEGV